MPLSVQSIDFLMENRLQNSREWYNEHKDRYQAVVLQPLMQLVEELYPAMYAIDPQLIIEPKVNRSISRIWRDSRFSKDKSLFRERMWLVFSRERKEPNCPPGFVFEFWPNGWRYGCGYYYTPPVVMQAVRELVLNRDKRFLCAQKALAAHPEYTLEGEAFKRPRYPNQPQELQAWLNRKSCCVLHNSRDFELLFSEHLGQTLAQGFKAMQPVYEFLLAASQIALQK